MLSYSGQNLCLPSCVLLEKGGVGWEVTANVIFCLSVCREARKEYLSLLEAELCEEIRGVLRLFGGKEVSVRLLNLSTHALLPRSQEQIRRLASKLGMVGRHGLMLVGMSYHVLPCPERGSREPANTPPE